MAFRLSTSFFNLPISIREIATLETKIDVVQEYWCILRRISHVRDLAIDLIKKNGIEDTKASDVFMRMSSHIKQGQNFFIAASNTSYNTAPLLYYYCFLNLVKALLLLKQVDLGDKPHHGLSVSDDNFNQILDLSKNKIKVGSSGVFPSFYSVVFGMPCNISDLDALTLLQYVPDIYYQLMEASLFNQRVYDGKSCLISNRSTDECWIRISIDKKANISKYSTLNSKFSGYFNRSDPDPSNRQWLRLEQGLSAIEVNELIFYEGKAHKPAIGIDPNIFRSEVYSAFDKNIAAHPYNIFDFRYYEPYSNDETVKMNEMIAIYVIFFFLSDLVRYRPYQLEDALTRKDSWLIESFVQSAPIIFLQLIISELLNRVYIVKRV